MLEHKGLFDLDIEFDKCSFNDKDFAYTSTYLDSHKLRGVKLYSNTNVRLLVFDYSYSGHGCTFVRFRNKRNYDPNVYYEVKDSGMSSGGGKVSIGLHNPWESIMSKWKLYTQQEWAFLHRYGNDFEFLNKVNDLDAIANEIKIEYMALPTEVRSVEYTSMINDSGVVLVGDYPRYSHRYDDYMFRLVYPNQSIELLSVEKFDRYRDGGTTEVSLRDSKGELHEFYYPSSCGRPKEEQIPTWDGKSMTREIPLALKDATIKLLGIVLDPHKKDD